jgi:hypothetical protein
VGTITSVRYAGPKGSDHPPGPEKFELLAARGVLAPPEPLDAVGRSIELRRLLEQRQIDPRSGLSEVGYWIGIGTRFASHIPKCTHAVDDSTVPSWKADESTRSLRDG